MLVGLDHERNSLDDGEPVPLETCTLCRIVRQQPHRADPKINENLSPGSVVARVRGVAEFDVGVYRVSSCVLQRVCPQLVEQADAAPFVTAHVQHDASTLGTHLSQGGVQLRSTVTSARSEDVSGQTLGMDSGEDLGSIPDVPGDQRNVFTAVDIAAVRHRAEVPVLGRERDFHDPDHV